MSAIPSTIRPVDDPALLHKVQARLDNLTKPPGSLGRLEEIVRWYCLARAEFMPELPRKVLYVFCADHGITAEGVSAYPSEVTPQMAYNFAGGGAAINALCRQFEIEAAVVDIGVAADLDPSLPILARKIAPGTRNFAHEPAMSRAQAEQAVAIGAELARQAVDAGATLLAAGEMGIGNTTAAAAVSAALIGCKAAEVAGRGTGVDDERLVHKTAVIDRALDARAPDAADPIDVLSKVGGFEIAAMAGFYLGAADRRAPSVVDGFIATAAALAAIRLQPALVGYLLFAHRSAESGHWRQLEAIGARPLLDLGMRLGEGTGAAIAMGLVAAALRTYREMASFESAGVSNRS